MAGCDCVRIGNASLEQQGINSKIESGIDLGSGTELAMVATTKRDPKSGRPKATLYATFCPFCGAEYPVGQEPPTDRKER